MDQGRSRGGAGLQKFQALGFENVVRGASLEIKEEVREPTLYQAAGVRIYGNCATNLAIVARIAEIHGRVQGKVYFPGGQDYDHAASRVGGRDRLEWTGGGPRANPSTRPRPGEENGMTYSFTSPGTSAV